MRTDVHFAALKAAAKVAFSVALLDGCASARGPSEANGAADLSTEGAGKTEQPPAEQTPTSCETVLANGFPEREPGDSILATIPVSKDVLACCDAEMNTPGFEQKHRWACCAAYDASTDAGALEPSYVFSHYPACTPWGPPVPPAMVSPVKTAADTVA